MLISAGVVRAPRGPRRCGTCGRPATGPVLRLYGAAHEGDPPYVLWVHPGCIDAGWAKQEPRLRAALAAAATPAPRGDPAP